MKKITAEITKDMYYDEAHGGLIVGEDDWGSNDRCWLYLKKGTIMTGYLEDGEDVWEPEYSCEEAGDRYEGTATTLSPEWAEIVNAKENDT